MTLRELADQCEQKGILDADWIESVKHQWLLDICQAVLEGNESPSEASIVKEIEACFRRELEGCGTVEQLAQACIRCGILPAIAPADEWPALRVEACRQALLEAGAGEKHFAVPTSAVGIDGTAIWKKHERLDDDERAAVMLSSLYRMKRNVAIGRAEFDYACERWPENREQMQEIEAELTRNESSLRAWEEKIAQLQGDERAAFERHWAAGAKVLTAMERGG
jgi:hypothetical protein